MKKMYLIKNQELFQGEKYLKTNKDYFEGWYYKNIKDKNSIAFIPGININNNEKKAFIQVITNTSSYFINYGIDKFKFEPKTFCIKIGDNYFTKNKIHIDIKDEENKLNINGELQYIDNSNIHTDIICPNIMGPFSYIPFMECNHAIVSMKNSILGSININNNEINLDNGYGYIEKDWGSSFPKSYIWCQGNNFSNKNVSFMCSIANIDFNIFEFRGIICVLKIEDKEYKFTTYNNAKLIDYRIKGDSINITLKKDHYIINIKSDCDISKKLLAPVKGKMDKTILESILASVTITLKKKNEVIFLDTSSNCGLEIVSEDGEKK